MLTAAVLLSGCSGDGGDGGDGDAPEPTRAPTTSTPPSPTTSSVSTPTETPPVMPPEARARDVDGAAAFIRYYFDVVNYANRTGDVARLTELSDEECQSCLNLIDTAANGYRNGGRIEGGQIIVGDVAVTPDDAANGLELRAVISQADGRFVDARGNELDVINAEVDYLLGAIVLYDTGWTLREWGDADDLS